MEEVKAKIEKELKTKLDSFEKKIDSLEYKDIKEIRGEVQCIKVDLAKNNLLTEQNTQAMNEMSKTMGSVRETMIQITGAIDSVSSANKELAINIKQQNEKIDEIKMRQDEIEDKSKFDIMDFIRNNFVAIVVGTGLLVHLFLK